MALDRFNLWQDGNHIGTKRLWEYLARYPYLPRLKNQEVLRTAVVTPPPQPPTEKKLPRFYGSVELDSARVVKEVGTIAESIIQHLEALVGADVTITLEIHADVPDGVPERVARAVTENANTLKFGVHGFEEG